MATTPIYGFETPDDTDLVKDGALSIRTALDDVDSTLGTALNSKLHAGLVLIKTQTIGSGVSSVTVTGAFSATYDVYKIVVTGGVASNTSDYVMSLGGITTGYNSRLLYGSFQNTSNNVANAQNGTAWSWIGGGNASNIAINMDLHNPFAAKPKWCSNVFLKFDNGDVGSTISYNNSTTSATSFGFAPSAGTMTGGTIAVYGYAKD